MMTESSPTTFFAPPERVSLEEVQTAARSLREHPLVQVLEKSLDGFMMILNPQRQVLAFNEDLLNFIGVPSEEELFGKRPGELLSCVHVEEGPNGCGTSRACAQCGAVLSVLSCQKTREVSTGECFLRAQPGGEETAFDFRVRATPLEVEGHIFTILLFHDISSIKRREALERTFFHDILNTVSGLMGLSGLLASLDNVDPKEMAKRIVALSQKLNREIQEQRQLSQAENGQLTMEKQLTPVREILESISPVFEAHSVARDKELEVDQVASIENLHTDPVLLGRVLVNMVKNAFEAIGPGEKVKVTYTHEKGQPCFRVWNPGVIPAKVAHQIFHRSFSTKGQPGRGLGTYSMKLFGERYLGGRVWFETDAEKGTTFAIALPNGHPRENN